MKRALAAIAVVVLVATFASAQGGAAAQAASAQADAAAGGAVASADPIATQAGLDALRDGGNAVDAAVATALALAVVFPQAGNLGGGGFAVVRMGERVEALDFREVAPAAATRDMYLDASGEPRPDASTVGALSAGVPGSPAGLFELHARHGALPWRRVVAPAERLASRGFHVSRRLAKDIAAHEVLLAMFPSTAQVFLPGGEPLAEASILTQPDLARTLHGYAARGPKAIQRGRVAKAIEECSRANGGILTAADLASYEARWSEPIRFDVSGWHVASMPLPSSGGTILAMTSGILERLDWAAAPRLGPDRAHLLAATWQVAYAERSLLGDPPDFQAKPEHLLKRGILDRFVPGIDRERARPSSTVMPWKHPAKWRFDNMETTHLSVVDGAGNAVALTTTLNGSFGSGLMVPGAGFLLNNEMDDFTTAPGRPNLYGLVQGAANEVGPGKRMLSSMSPTIAWRDGEVLALGSPGGSRIPTSVLQVLLNVVVDGDTLQGAVDHPRLHHQWLPDELVAEPLALVPQARAELERRGHVVREVRQLGEVHAVRRFADGRCEAAADPRGPGAAAVLPRARDAQHDGRPRWR